MRILRPRSIRDSSFDGIIWHVPDDQLRKMIVDCWDPHLEPLSSLFSSRPPFFCFAFPHPPLPSVLQLPFLNAQSTAATHPLWCRLPFLRLFPSPSCSTASAHASRNGVIEPIFSARIEPNKCFFCSASKSVKFRCVFLGMNVPLFSLLMRDGMSR